MHIAPAVFRAEAIKINKYVLSEKIILSFLFNLMFSSVFKIGYESSVSYILCIEFLFFLGSLIININDAKIILTPHTINTDTRHPKLLFKIIVRALNPAPR